MRLMRTPKTVEIAVTNDCNLRCKYCYHFTGAGDVAGDLPLGEWLEFFKELNRCAVMNVILGGGEPFHRKDLKGLIDGIVKNRMRFCVLSNGTLITDDMAEFLASTKRCDNVQVSIDGSIPTTHDAMRGEGSFLKAVEGIKCLKTHKVPIAVRVTIHRKNVMDLDNIAKFLLDDIGLLGFGTNSASYMGLCRKNSEQVQLTAEDRSAAMEALLRLNRIYNGRIGGQAGPLAEAQMWLEMEHAKQERKGKSAGRGCLASCGGVMTKIGVRADGIIVPCSLLSHIELGRINKDALEDIWQNHPELRKVRERKDIPLGNFGYCKRCEYINYCRGNCPAFAYTLVGRVNHPNPDACLRKFLQEGGRLPEKNLLYV